MAANGAKAEAGALHHEIDDGPTVVTDFRTESQLYTWTVSSWSAYLAGAGASQYVLATPALKAPSGLEVRFGIFPPTASASAPSQRLPRLYVNLSKGPVQPVRIGFEVSAFDDLKQPFTEFQSQWDGCRRTTVPVTEAVLCILSGLRDCQELTFRIKLTLADQPIHQTYDVSSDTIVLGKELSDSSVRGDIAKLLGDTSWSDVVLKVGENHTFPAHRAILAARSPVFAAMFKTDGQFMESRQQIVPVHDVEPSAMPYILEYLYTGGIATAAAADDLQVPYQDILIATDKYDLPGLKRLCEEALANRQLCEDNVCELLLFADRHNAVLLKRKCVEYVKKHAGSVARAEHWRELAAANSSLFADLTCELLEGMGELLEGAGSSK